MAPWAGLRIDPGLAPADMATCIGLPSVNRLYRALKPVTYSQSIATMRIAVDLVLHCHRARRDAYHFPASAPSLLYMSRSEFFSPSSDDQRIKFSSFEGPGRLILSLISCSQ
jgi:hypothetical protein